MVYVSPGALSFENHVIVMAGARVDGDEMFYFAFKTSPFLAR